MFPILCRVVADAAIIAIVLFGTARTIEWTQAWTLIATLLVVRIGTAIIVSRVNPTLLRERATVLIHRGQPRADQVLLLIYMTTAFIGVPLVAGLDVFQWRLIPAPPSAIAASGLAMFATGWIITGAALKENAFAVTVVRHQTDRNQRVVDTGVYSLIRHPMYAGAPLVLIGMSLWLESITAALFAVVPLALLITRIRLEERFLDRQLPGYTEYTRRVRYRLVPGVW